MPTDPGAVTRLLRRFEEGDKDAVGEILRHAEDDLRRIARQRKRALGGVPGIDADTTALVNDLGFRLLGRGISWEDRRKFFGYFAKSVHCFLIDELRKQRVRGGVGTELDADVRDPRPRSVDHYNFLLDLEAALGRLEEQDPDGVLFFRMHRFLGTPFQKIAEDTNVPKTTVLRQYNEVTRRLRDMLKEYGNDS